MEQKKKRLVSKHNVVWAKNIDGKLSRQVRAGDAFLHEDDDYYVLKLALFPFSYFIRKNKESDNQYTVFAKRVFHDDAARLQDPIGRARLCNDIKTHLQINIPLLRLNLYMCLFPA